MPRATRDVKVINEQGLHARPAMRLVDVANRFEASVEITRLGEDQETVDGKSIMLMLTLMGVEGTVYRLEADGPDAQELVDALANEFAEKFGEA
jgi:phosphocarrier protein HPr